MSGVPVIPVNEIADVLWTSYGLRVGAAEPTGGEFHLNLRTETQRGLFLVKVGVSEVDGVETWRDRILLHLQRAAPELPVPRIIRTVNGRVSALWSVGQEIWQVRVYGWLDGEILAKVEPTFQLLRDLGCVSARVTEALVGFDDSSMKPHLWDLRTAPATIRANIEHVADAGNRAAVDRILSFFEAAEHLMESLPVAVVHHDLNDYNVLVTTEPRHGQRISGIVDFNDALTTYRVADVAIAAAYAMLRRSDPLEAAAAVVGGYHAHTRLSEAELRVVFPLAAARLCLNATVWTGRVAMAGEDEATRYASRRMADTWPTIRLLSRIQPECAYERILAGCQSHPTDHATSRDDRRTTRYQRTLEDSHGGS